MLRPKKKKFIQGIFDNEKKFLRLGKIPHSPPHNFSNGPSLNQNYVFHFLLMTKLPVREGNAL